MQPGETDYRILSEKLVYLKEATLVNDFANDGLHTVGLTGISGHQRIEFWVHAPGIVGRFNGRRGLGVVRG